MARPLVSVVTPSYNQAAYVEDTLLSVKRQRYPNVEHVVVDGGSTDGTVDLLREHETDYDLRWTSEPDDGQSDAINTGFDRARGAYVGWLNSDDVYVDTGVLGRVVEHFERTGVDVLYGDLCYLDADSVVTGVDVRPPFDRAELAYRSLIGQPATFFRREVLAEERLDPDFHFTMDWEFWLRLSASFEFRHVPDLLAGFRFHGEQKTEDRAAMEREYRRLRRKHGIETTRPASALPGVAATEVTRTLRALAVTVELHRSPPELAFDGRLAPLPTMLRNLGPGVADVRKSLRRFLS